jgi:predicted regulator of Ras-like GTPase activity (Roadblock/LC7/MglB family)
LSSGDKLNTGLDWLITDFTNRVTGVAHAVVVSADGMPLAVSDTISPGHVGELCAITAGLASLNDGAARILDGGLAIQALVVMQRGLMVIKAISGGASLAVLAAPDCDIEFVSYEMTILVEAAGDVLTPANRTL